MGEGRRDDDLAREMLQERPTIIRPKGTNYRSAVICFSGAAVIFLVGAIRALYESNDILYACVTGAILFSLPVAGIARLRVELHVNEIRFTGIFRLARTLRLDQIRVARGAARGSYLGLYMPLLIIEPTDPQQRPMAIPTSYFTHADINIIRDFLGERLKRRPSRSGR